MGLIKIKSGKQLHCLLVLREQFLKYPNIVKELSNGSFCMGTFPSQRTETET